MRYLHLTLLGGLLLAAPFVAKAGDLSAGLYISMSLGKGESYYGLRAGFDATGDSDVSVENIGQMLQPEAGIAVLDVRNHFAGGQEILLNGTRLTSDYRLHADSGASSQSSDSQFDGQVLAAVVVGAALIAAIANADSVKGCVGTACPEPDPPEQSAED